VFTSRTHNMCLFDNNKAFSYLISYVVVTVSIVGNIVERVIG